MVSSFFRDFQIKSLKFQSITLKKTTSRKLFIESVKKVKQINVRI